MIKPQDLSGRAREAYSTWRSLGLTEAAAMDAVIEDGHVELSDHDRLVRNFRTMFGLSEQAAEVAAGGRGGSSASAPAAESRASGGSDDAARLIGIIEAWRQDLLAHGQLCVERGETREQAALKEAFSKVFLAARSVAESAWVLGVATARWPELSRRHSARSGGVSETGKPSSSRSGSGGDGKSRPVTVAEFVTDREQSTLRRGSRG